MHFAFFFLPDFEPRLEGTARYAGSLLAPAEGFGQGFLVLLARKTVFFWCFADFRLFLKSKNNIQKSLKNLKLQKGEPNEERKNQKYP